MVTELEISKEQIWNELVSGNIAPKMYNYTLTMQGTAYIPDINPRSRAHPFQHLHPDGFVARHLPIGGFADSGQVDDVAGAVSSPVQWEPEPGIADYFGRLRVILYSGSWGEKGVPPMGWTSILPYGGNRCVDIRRTFPYQLFNGYDEFEINNTLDFSALFMV